MLAGMISSIASMIISRHSLYDSLKVGFLEKLNKEVRALKTSFISKIGKKKINISLLTIYSHRISKNLYLTLLSNNSISPNFKI